MDEDKPFFKQLLEATLLACQPYLSTKTPFLHYDAQSEGCKECISLKENFFFVLALMKTHQQKNVLNAKALLERLLAFQQPHLGAFPTYLHNYPSEGRYEDQLDILATQIRIYLQYNSVFKQEEVQALLFATQKLTNYLYDIHLKHPFGSLNRWKFVSCLQASQAFLKGSYFQEMNQLPEITQELYAPEALGDLLLFAALFHEAKLPSSLVKLLSLFWDEKQQIYTGPDTFPQFYENEAMPSLLHLLMQRSLPAYLPLHTALKAQIFFSYDRLPSFKTPQSFTSFSFSGGKLYLVKKNLCIMKGQHFFSTGSRFFPLLAFFQEEGQRGSLCLETASPVENMELTDGGVQFQLSIVEAKDPLLSLYFSKSVGSQVLIGESPATCFCLEDDIYLKSKAKLFKVEFFTEGFSNKLIGHVKLGNRPGQRFLKGKPLLPALDWQVYLRNLDLHPQHVIQCRITYLGT